MLGGLIIDTIKHDCPCRRPDGDVSLRLMSAFIRLNRHHWHRQVTYDLRPHEFSLLYAIRRFSMDRGEGPRISELSERQGVRPPTITQQVSELERRGLVVRSREEGDRRAVRVALSPEGLDLLERNRASVLTLFSEVSKHLGPERGEQLAALLAEAADFLEESK